MGKCQFCARHGRDNEGPYLWIRAWPINFRLVDCPNCGAVDDEDWLWGALFRAVTFLFPWNGWMHSRRHPWWETW